MSLWLWLKGYRVRKRNLRLRSGEVDLLTLHQGAWVLVEVRSRRERKHGWGALPEAKRRRLIRLAEEWRGRPDSGGLPVKVEYWEVCQFEARGFLVDAD